MSKSVTKTFTLSTVKFSTVNVKTREFFEREKVFPISVKEIDANALRNKISELNAKNNPDEIVMMISETKEEEKKIAVDFETFVSQSISADAKRKGVLYVNRTIKASKFLCDVVDVEKREFSQRYVHVQGTPKQDEKLVKTLDAINRENHPDEIVFKADDLKVVEDLRAMDYMKFISLGHEVTDEDEPDEE